MSFSNTTRDWRRRLLFAALLIGLTFLYISPGGSALLAGRTDTVMSDDTDPSTLPFFYDKLVDTWQHHPSWFFYGAVFNEGRMPEGVFTFWAPWFERFSVPFWANFFPIEQVTTAFIFSLFILNFLAMYALCRYLQWARPLSVALSLSWAFCAYTRARAKVHGALTGTFHVPLIFLGLLLVARGKTWRSMLLATLVFLFACTTAHYYIVTSAFLAPFFVLFFALQPEVKAQWKKAVARLLMALIPSIGFLAFNYLKPMPNDPRIKAEQAIPKGGDTKDGSTHPFLRYFAARPFDYLAGDIAMGTSDLNPIRSLISESILNNLDNSNPHERSNGIRWIFILVSGFAIFMFFKKKFATEGPLRTQMIFFMGFALFTFWLSLSPDVPFANSGPSLWLYSLMSQVRVSSRAGIWVHFALLIITGLYLNQFSLNQKKASDKKKKVSDEPPPKFIKWLLIPTVLPGIVLLELPPLLQPMPMAPVRPRIEQLQLPSGKCGAGMYFPFVSPQWSLREHYHFLQRMRGSECVLYNSWLDPARNEMIMRRFGLHPQIIEAIQRNDPRLLNGLESLVRCAPLTWLFFDERVPLPWQNQACQRLGWTLYPNGACVAPDPSTPMVKPPEQCL